MLVIIPAVGYHHFLPGLRLPCQSQNIALPMDNIKFYRLVIGNGCEQLIQSCYVKAERRTHVTSTEFAPFAYLNI